MQIGTSFEKPHKQGWQCGTVRYVGTVRYASIFAKKYGALVRHAFFVMVRYVGTVRLSCSGTGTVVRCLNLPTKRFMCYVRASIKIRVTAPDVHRV